MKKMNRHALFLFLAIASSIVALAEKPNILVILVDDMGFGDAGCFNPDSKIATPYIDKLAAEGMTVSYTHLTLPTNREV